MPLTEVVKVETVHAHQLNGIEAGFRQWILGKPQLPIPTSCAHLENGLKRTFSQGLHPYEGMGRRWHSLLTAMPFIASWRRVCAAGKKVWLYWDCQRTQPLPPQPKP